MFRNFQKVFGFTFRNQVTAKGYLVSTLLLAALLLLGPAIGLPAAGKWMESHGDRIEECKADTIAVVNETGREVDFTVLNELDEENYDQLRYVTFGSMEEALSSASETTLVWNLTMEEDNAQTVLVVPDQASFGTGDAEHFNEFLRRYSGVLSELLLGRSQEDTAMKMLSTSSSEVLLWSDYLSDDGSSAAAREASANDTADALGFIVPYATMMVMYFLIILYGNGVTQNVVLEKSSKLMDTMLVSVRPEAMVLGKMLAVVAAALIQVVAWVLSLIIGFTVGIALFVAMIPETVIGVVSLAEMNGTPEVSYQLFSAPGIFAAVLIVLLGFVMYCALAAIAGALAKTKEEAGSTSSIFIFLLLASFLIAISQGGMDGAAPLWVQLLPFTSVLVTPAAAVMGTIPAPMLLLAIALLVAFSLFLTAAAGRIYKMASLYKGNVPKPGKIIRLILGVEKEL